MDIFEDLNEKDYGNFKKPVSGIIVDAASSGNPGLSKYRGMDLSDDRIVFKKNIGYATNNVAEFLALVHAIASVIQWELPAKAIIYSDSQTALAWIEKKAIATSMRVDGKTQMAQIMVDRALIFLNEKDISRIEIRKWETRSWGENPADYGYKK